MSNNQKKFKTAITPTREEDYPEWYQQVIKAADLAENAAVRGCMVIKPWGYAIWELIQAQLDTQIKATGHKNVYCPLFIPISLMEKEAEHVAGFAKECAVITHHRLEPDNESKRKGALKPAGKLEEPLIIRPTSEAIIGPLFSNWIQSYRDLPLKINQWANVVRWEMRTRLFLRTTEFLWQEGHTAHASATDANSHAKKMLDVYVDFVEKNMAIPVIAGEKSENERFPGADNTYCIEAMMQDKKALQAGTSHFLGQNFAKAFNIKYLTDQSNEAFCWTTSWGVSTRLMGGLIMTHSDDDGLVLPPRIAPSHVVIIPLIHKDEDKDDILKYCNELCDQITNQNYNDSSIRVEIDLRDVKTAGKSWHWVKRGVPIRLEVGKKELEQNTVFMGRRDLSYKDRKSVSIDEFISEVSQTLDDIQDHLYQKALDFQKENTHSINSKEEFDEYFSEKNKNTAGFAKIFWAGDAKFEDEISKKYSISIRCIPFNGKVGKCIFTGKDNASEVIFSRAY
jgi:prolyl-tRNA synthetase